MTRKLTSSEQTLVRRMTQSKEESEWGFELLAERRRGDLASFFDPLAQAGLFDPQNNPEPVPSDREGFVRIPFWPALRYLKLAAMESGEKSDFELAKKIMDVVRSVSTFREPGGNIRDNDNTIRVFAEILGLIPPAAITQDDIELIPVWLSSKYDRGHVAATLDKGFMRRALSSESANDWDKACRILYHCTAIEWVPDHWIGEADRLKPISVVEDYWLKKLIEHHAEAFGTKAGQQASDIFVGRLREVFDPERTVPSHWARSTIEDSDQNSPVDGPGDRFVEGLRDVLLHWVNADVSAARGYVRAMLDDDPDIIRRIAIHTINHQWSQLQELYFAAVSVELFSDAHLHELYQLLRAHFGEFTDQQKAKTLEIIRSIPPEDGEDSERWLSRTQRNWLSAIMNQGYEPADRWYKELEADPKIGRLSKHPSLHSYHESWSGPGPSPYSIKQLLKHAQDGTIVDVLHSFTETDGFQGPDTPTIRALVDVLSEAVKQHPHTFFEILPTFLKARRPFQYGVINGLKQLWDDTAKNEEAPVDWERAWAELVTFLTALLTDCAFWVEKAVEDQNLTPNRDWIPPLVASFLKAGTQRDEHAYDESLLPQTWELIKILLNNLQGENDVGDDPMFTAINSSRGKAIEALFNHALRWCRVRQNATAQHADVWENMRSAFENELDKCKDGNYEMSTLSGSYIANLDYLSCDWLAANVEAVFPDRYKVNFACAVDGMAYAPEHRGVYNLLIEKEIIDKALRLDLRGRHSREKLIQRIALAYLRGDEELDGPRFSFIFESNAAGDLEEAGDLFWSVSSQRLRPDQVELVLDFWNRCVEWSKTLDQAPEALLSSLSKLACYVKDIGNKEAELLVTVAPYVHVGHDADRFIEELERLADTYPKETGFILGRVLERYRPVFDFEDRLKSLIRKIAAAGGAERSAAISYADKLCQLRLSGMCDLFRELQNG